MKLLVASINRCSHKTQIVGHRQCLNWLRLNENQFLLQLRRINCLHAQLQPETLSMFNVFRSIIYSFLLLDDDFARSRVFAKAFGGGVSSVNDPNMASDFTIKFFTAVKLNQYVNIWIIWIYVRDALLPTATTTVHTVCFILFRVDSKKKKKKKEERQTTAHKPIDSLHTARLYILFIYLSDELSSFCYFSSSLSVFL